jgi:hypothetical protein
MMIMNVQRIAGSGSDQKQSKKQIVKIKNCRFFLVSICVYLCSPCEIAACGLSHGVNSWFRIGVNLKKQSQSFDHAQDKFCSFGVPRSEFGEKNPAKQSQSQANGWKFEVRNPKSEIHPQGTNSNEQNLEFCKTKPITGLSPEAQSSKLEIRNSSPRDNFK